MSVSSFPLIELISHILCSLAHQQPTLFISMLPSPCIVDYKVFQAWQPVVTFFHAAAAIAKPLKFILTMHVHRLLSRLVPFISDTDVSPWTRKKSFRNYMNVCW